MNTNRQWQPATKAENRFKILEFINPRSGSKSWRVSGIKRDGERVRENFHDLDAAKAKQYELQGEWLARQTDTSLRATKLTETQVRLAEVAFVRLDLDDDILRAVDHWLKTGKAQAIGESPRLDDAALEFNGWLDTTATLRERTKMNLKLRVGIFTNSIRNLRVADITPEVIDSFLAKRDVSAATKDNDKRALSRFFSWCIERPRRWLTSNPCREVKVEKPERPPPSILTLDQCERLLRAAEAHKDGMLVPYVVVCLFAGLRPFEAGRLQWDQVNLEDGEIRIHAIQSKTGKPRTIGFNDGPPEQKPFNAALTAWLAACKDKPFFPVNWRKEFDAVKELAGIVAWPEDVMRHTAISHFFRLTGSYGRTAELFGNSESIIKAHYQGKVNSSDAAKFYGTLPMKGN